MPTSKTKNDLIAKETSCQGSIKHRSFTGVHDGENMDSHGRHKALTGK